MQYIKREAQKTIDEIQYAPNLLPYIKMEVDKSDINGQYWLTGSQHFNVMKGVGESLAGRAAVLNLRGLSLREMLGVADRKPFLPSAAFATHSETGGMTMRGFLEILRDCAKQILIDSGNKRIICLTEDNL